MHVFSPVTSRLDIFPPSRNQSFQAAETKESVIKAQLENQYFSSRLCSLGGEAALPHDNEQRPKHPQSAVKQHQNAQQGSSTDTWPGKPHQYWFHVHDQYLSLSLYEAGPVSWHSAVLKTPLMWKVAQINTPHRNDPDTILSVSFHELHFWTRQGWLHEGSPVFWD